MPLPELELEPPPEDDEPEREPLEDTMRGLLPPDDEEGLDDPEPPRELPPELEADPDDGLPEDALPLEAELLSLVEAPPI